MTWSAALARALDPGFLISDEERLRQRTALDDFAAYLRGLLPARRRSPGGDLISALIGVHDSGASLTEDELIGMCMLLLIAGHETTRSLIGGAVLALLRYPAELAALAAQPSLTEQAVEEVLRYDPPVQMLSRFALRSAEVAGVMVPALFVLMLAGAANRDAALCADPDRFPGAARHGTTWRSGTGSTSASARRSRGSRRPSRCGSCCRCSPGCGSRGEPAVEAEHRAARA